MFSNLDIIDDAQYIGMARNTEVIGMTLGIEPILRIGSVLVKRNDITSIYFHFVPFLLFPYLLYFFFFKHGLRHIRHNILFVILILCL